MPKYIETNGEYRVGTVDEEIIQDARNAGLSEEGVLALVSGDKIIFKRELDALEKRCPGNIWACSRGYGLWFNSATDGERRRDEIQLERELKCLCR